VKIAIKITSEVDKQRARLPTADSSTSGIF
jgi:hypothetical protein